jgi:8-oxo-dGTP pyrophosphatase MutT (NUDIX family)
VLPTPVFKVIRRSVISPKDGRVKAFTVVSAPSWVNIMAFDRDRRVVLVRQYRHGSRSFSLELPGGIMDEGEEPLGAALRELAEETGYSAGRAEILLSVNPNPALFGNSITTVIAWDAVRTSGTSFDENEEAESVLLTLDELEKAYREGGFCHALMVAPIGYFLAVRDRYL